MSSPTQIAANRANALLSTGPRTPEGKAISSRNALSHGAYASDDTLLAITLPPAAGSAAEDPTAPQPATTGAAPAVPPQQEALSPYLAAYTQHDLPVGPAETLLVRRLAACAARLDLLAQSLDALLTLDERHALLAHLDERYSLSSPATQFRKQPDWTGPIYRYDGIPYVSHFPDEKPDNPALDPDPAACILAYTVTSRRAATLFQLEERAERRFLTLLKELHSLQALRRRSFPTHPGAPTPEQSLIEAIDLRVGRVLAAHGLDPDARPVPKPHPVSENEPNSAPTPLAGDEPSGRSEPIDKNEPTAHASLKDGNEPNAIGTSQLAPTPAPGNAEPPYRSEPIAARPLSAGAAPTDQRPTIRKEGSQSQPAASSPVHPVDRGSTAPIGNKPDLACFSPNAVSLSRQGSGANRASFSHRRGHKRRH